MKKAETQEQEFLEVCSSYDHDLLTGKKEMTLKDYERITYLVSSLGYSQYLQFLIGKYMDLAQADEEREEREHEIYLEYPEYYEDEGILEEEKWLVLVSGVHDPVLSGATNRFLSENRKPIDRIS